MSSITTILTELNREHNVDFWSDVARIEIRNALNELSADEWKELISDWNKLSEEGCIKLAEAATISTGTGAMDLLTNMLQSRSTKVGVAVAEALIEKNYLWDPENSLLNDLRRHLSNTEGGDRDIIQRLINRLPS